MHAQMWIPHTYKHKPKLHVIYIVGSAKWGIVVLLWPHLSVTDLYVSEERPSVAIRIERTGRRHFTDGEQMKGRDSAQKSESS